MSCRHRPAALLPILLCACAAGPGSPPEPPRAGAAADAASPSGAPLRAVVHQEVQEPESYGPEILLPPPGSTDDVVATVGTRELRKSQAFSRLVAADPELAVTAVDLLVFDVLVAELAKKHGIRVDPAAVERLAVKEEEELRERIRAELGENADFAGYVERIFGMRPEDWRNTTRLRIAQRYYHGYVIRYLALLEDRVQVRYVVNRDRAVVAEVAEKVRQGADFATLALRHSEDSYRSEGGLLPPIGRDFPHPIAEEAFAMRQGELSEILAKDVGGVQRYYLIYCLQRLPGRQVPFEQVRAELEAELQRKPLTPLETNAFTLRYRSSFEAEAQRKDEDRAKEDRGR